MSDKEWGGGASTGEDRRLIEKLLSGALVEQRRARRWGVFFKLMTLLWLFAVAGSLFMSSRSIVPAPAGKGEGYTALIEVDGVIASGEQAGADNIVGGLREAFDDPNVKGVILRINSPGGSPVQSGYIYDEIRRLKGDRDDLKVYAVIVDIGASGAYYIASAADEIYADKASLVGSIGAYMASFGLDGVMDKVGVTRRFYKSGDFKGFSDPFQPEDPVAAEHIKTTVASIHQQFIDSVKLGRGDRLSDDPLLYSGLIWSGEQAEDLGLVDGLGSSSYVARELIGEEMIVDFTPQLSPFERFARQLGMGVMHTMVNVLGLDGLSVR
ncbi:S49 family peptidase [Kistimonas asteriae]|uniref:S49 family peptidase n=1 Tax=Kistimonas asteriae TaxID=517724 RepID=UPI001BAB474F|nr:S49 family peptidase [Kistimonas asteriae]